MARVVALNEWTIRAERPDDADAVGALLRDAFGGQDEARLVAALHAAGAAPVALVAVGDEGADADTDAVIGHVLFSPLIVETDRGEIGAAALAPLAVAGGWRRRGIGAALCREGIERCRELGVPGMVVLGDPAFYGRFGFRADLAAGFVSPWSGPHLMALELAPGGLGGGACRLRYHPAFEGLG
ncbi:MAG: GNAT family N-acetyltransferase [Thermomicrobiales bacterium]